MKLCLNNNFIFVGICLNIFIYANAYSMQLWDQIENYLKTEDINKFAELIQNNNIDINSKIGPENKLLLLEAAGLGKLDIVKLLLRKGADPRIVTNEGDTVLARVLSFQTISVNPLNDFFRIMLELLENINDLNFLEKVQKNGKSAIGKFNIYGTTELRDRILELKKIKQKSGEKINLNNLLTQLNFQLNSLNKK